MSLPGGMPVGADPAQVRDLGRQFKTHSDTIGDLISKISAILPGVTWKDGYIDQLRQDWDQTLRSALTKLQTGLQNVSTSANTRAGDYERLQQRH